MTDAVEGQMNAVVIDRFGGPEVLSVRKVPTPEPKPSQVLIRVKSAGVGVWDVGDRQGFLAKILGVQPQFPWILGSEGAGEVVATGNEVDTVRVGDRVYGGDWLSNPKTGFYAEYKALDAGAATTIPSNLSTEEAGALLIDGSTALRGLDDTLKLKQGERFLIFGASGGLGHLALQIGKRLGARVFAVASGQDGVDLASKLGADVAVDGRAGSIEASAAQFAPGGFDAALITAAGEPAEKALITMRPGGRVAYPWVNQRPPPKAPSNVRLLGYNANSDRDLVSRLNKLVESGSFKVHLGRTFKLSQTADAFECITSHHLGRVAVLPAKE